MADIFISYSSKDRAQAEQLTELLASAGLSVWISVDSLDGAACYNLACLYLDASDTERCVSLLRRSIDKGFQSIETFHHDPDLASLRGTPEFDALMKELEDKIEKAKHG